MFPFTLRNSLLLQFEKRNWKWIWGICRRHPTSSRIEEFRLLSSRSILDGRSCHDSVSLASFGGGMPVWFTVWTYHFNSTKGVSYNPAPPPPPWGPLLRSWWCSMSSFPFFLFWKLKYPVWLCFQARTALAPPFKWSAKEILSKYNLTLQKICLLGRDQLFRSFLCSSVYR